MEIQKTLTEHAEALDNKSLIEAQIKNLTGDGQIDFNLLPMDFAKELKSHCLKELKEAKTFMDSQVEEMSIWIDGLADKIQADENAEAISEDIMLEDARESSLNARDIK